MRAKKDQNQRSFDFEFAEALARQLEDDNNREDEYDVSRSKEILGVGREGASPSPQVIGSGGEGVDSGNASVGQRDLFNQRQRDGHSRPLGAERTGEIESAGRTQSDALADEGHSATERGSRYTGDSGGIGAVAQRPGASRNSDDARSGYGHTPNEFRTVTPDRLQHIAEASNGRVEIVSIGFNDQPVKAPKIQTAPVDYRITDEDRLGRGGAKSKFRDNIEALKVLKRLQSEGAAFASPEDQKTMVRYVGWGGLPQAFDPDNAAWRSEFEELRQLLDSEEYVQARRSTQDAHYTSQEVVQGIYQGLGRLGFKGPALALEPSAAIGHFIGLMPEKLKTDSRFTAIELDSVSSKIGKYLYPTVEYLNLGFQNANAPNDHFDLVVGNPPFGNQKIYDASRPDLDFSIHNYFMARSIDSLREGGIAAFVVSRYFLDAEVNPARDYIASKANLLGAIRLPHTAFKQNALTEVTTDIVFLQKTSTPAPEPAWLKCGDTLDGEGNQIRINQYFIDNPGQMAGKMSLDHRGMFPGSAELIPAPDFTNFQDEITRRLDILPQSLYQPRKDLVLEPSRKDDPRNLEVCASLKEDAFFLTVEGHLAQRQSDVLGQPRYKSYEPKNKKAGERIAGMIPIRDCLAELMRMEQSPEALPEDLERLRSQLNRLYDDFKQKHGHINSASNKQAMRDDPSYPLLSALEFDYDPGLSKEQAAKKGLSPVGPSANKAHIFKHRVLGPKKKITYVETAKEALVVSMNEKGKPDIEYMETLYGQPADKIVGELSGLIYFNPENEAWEIADHYLTGNVKAKLEQAQAAATKDTRFKENVEALTAVQPPDLEPVDIAVQLGSTWVPPAVVGDFCRHLFGPNSVNEIGYHPALGHWVATFNLYSIDPTTGRSTWGTDNFSGPELIEAILNHTPIKVMKEVGRDYETGKPIKERDEEETAAANQKADLIKQEFQNWIWQDQSRRDSLARIYNDRFNTSVPRKYDGSHLELPGSSMAITLRPHQKDSIWRGIQDGEAIFDHDMGGGKTLICVGTVMESKRMGLMKKPMVVVPNHLLSQWKDAFYSLYPQASVLIADKTDFKKENREKLFAKVATGDWDAVVVAHSSFKRIGLPPEALEKVLTEQIDDLSEAIEEMKVESGSRHTVKEMEKTKERLKVMMERRADTGTKDRAVTFADLGVDALFVDESHEFKNLFITTRMRNVAGLGNVAGSDKSFDLYVKCRYLQDKNKGKGVFFATGTPISNTIAEMYTIQRFLQHSLLKEKGLTHFDAWASTFGEVTVGWELDATGVGYKLNSRFAKFQNMPELVNMYRMVGDVVSKQDIVEQNKGQRLTPKIKGGKPTVVIAERSDLQAEYMGTQKAVTRADGSQVMEWPSGSIIHRMENLPKDPRVDNPLKITNDARKAGLDYRLIDPDAPDFSGSKVNLAVDEIVRIWKKWEADRGTQLVFCDLSTPKGAKKDVTLTDDAETSQDDAQAISMDELLSAGAGFSVYDDLKQKLIAKGVPAHEISFIHEANTDIKKAKLFDDVNQGKVRVLMGSTAKMGAGTNVQKRLVALHHLDAPWRPSDILQRDGRIDRPGNLLFKRDPEGFEVEIIRYATKQTYDARMWQVIETKAAAIEQFRKGDNLARVIDDVASEAANAAEMKAAATGNELIFIQVKLKAELKKMEGIYSNFVRSQHQLERRIARLEEAPAHTDREIARFKKDKELRDNNTRKESVFFSEGEVYGEKHREPLLKTVASIMKRAIQTKEPQTVGMYRGFDIKVESGKDGCQFLLEGEAGIYQPDNLRYGPESKFDIHGFIQRLDNYLGKFESFIENAKTDGKRQAQELIVAKERQGQPFPQMELLETLREDNSRVMAELMLTQKDPSYKSGWRPKSFNEVGANQKPKVEPEEIFQISPSDPSAAAERIKAVISRADQFKGQAFEVGKYRNTMVSLEVPQGSKNSFNIRLSGPHGEPIPVEVERFAFTGGRFSLKDLMHTIDRAINNAANNGQAADPPKPDDIKTDQAAASKPQRSKFRP